MARKAFCAAVSAACGAIALAQEEPSARPAAVKSAKITWAMVNDLVVVSPSAGEPSMPLTIAAPCPGEVLFT